MNTPQYPPFDIAEALLFIDAHWRHEVIATLLQYMTIPCVSPNYCTTWADDGHILQAMRLVRDWYLSHQAFPDMKVAIHEIEGRTPLLFVEIPASPGATGGEVPPDTILLYGHLDKQPGMADKWTDTRSPWNPTFEDGGDKLYGRGGADDGYAAFASLAAVAAVRAQGLPHQRIVILIEADEESGSGDLPSHVEALRDRIGTPDLVICLDSGCARFDELWVTTSLRGVVGGTLRVDVLTHGVHSGKASGIVPDPTLVAMQLIGRIADLNATDGSQFVMGLHSLDRLDMVSDAQADAAEAAAEVIGDEIVRQFPWQGDPPQIRTNRELASHLIASTLCPALTITGEDGLPKPKDASNTLHPWKEYTLSFRIPPNADPEEVLAELKHKLESGVPVGTKVTFTPGHGAAGWAARPFHSWLQTSLNQASLDVFGKPVQFMGEGGTIPFMGMLQKQFPEAQIVVTGVLGPDTNAHGPDEYLHIPTTKKLTASVGALIDASARDAYLRVVNP